MLHVRYVRVLLSTMNLGVAIVGHAIHSGNPFALDPICVESNAGTVKQRSETSYYRRRLLEGLFPVGDEVSKQRPRYEIQLALLWKEDERNVKQLQA